MYKVMIRYLSIFIISAVLAQILVQIYLARDSCETYVVPASHLAHPLLKMASQVKKITNIVTLIFEDMDSIDFLQNTILEAQKVGIKDYLVIALNDTSCELLQEKCYYNNTFRLPILNNSSINATSNNETITYTTSMELNKALTRAHIWLELLRNNYSIFSISSNVFLRDNPLMYIDRTVDINALTEYPPGIGSPIWKTLRDKYHMCCNGTERYLHPAFIFLAATNCSIAVVEDMIQLETVNNTNEIDALNIALYQRRDECDVRVLQKDLFPNGFVNFLLGEPQRLGFSPVAILNNWESNSTGMIYRAREMLSWDLDPSSRFNTSGRQFITYSTQTDYVTFFQERNFLMLTFMLGKILNREVILPLFHCYIGEPPSCLLDVLFDPLSFSSNLTYLEHSFFSSASPRLPPACKISLKMQQQQGELIDKEILLDDLAEFLEGRKRCIVLELEFPAPGRNGYHLSLGAFPDRRGNEQWAAWVNTIESGVVWNTHALFSQWYTWWVKDLKEMNITCVISDGYKTDNMTLLARKLARGNPLYVLSPDPSRPTPKHLYDIDKNWFTVFHGFDTAWVGYRMMQGHSVLTHLQMEVCSSAQYIIVNAYGPTWLLDGIMAMRTMQQSSVASASFD